MKEKEYQEYEAILARWVMMPPEEQEKYIQMIIAGYPVDHPEAKKIRRESNV